MGALPDTRLNVEDKTMRQYPIWNVINAVNVDTVMNKPGASYTERAGQYYTVT